MSLEKLQLHKMLLKNTFFHSIQANLRGPSGELEMSTG